jgi:CheY-like chemotaxis protein
MVDAIRTAAERAAALTRQLLAFSRHQVLQPRQIDLNDTVINLTKMLRRIVGEDVRVELGLHQAPVLTRADPGMIDQVLLNLAVNARDAMEAGGRLRIETGFEVVDQGGDGVEPALPAGHYVRLSVSDTGSGIPEALLPRIFEPFFTTKEPGKGTGLGLATVFGIVKQHEGAISVVSDPGEGTTFRILLPAAAAAAAPALVDAAPEEKPRGGSETILLVEDEPMVRRLARTALERSGYTVLEAPSGVEAIEIWNERRADIRLLMTDLVMPGGVSGRDLAARLQADEPNLRVLFTSGYSAEIAGRDPPLVDGQNFVQKPYRLAKLLEIVRRRLD